VRIGHVKHFQKIKNETKTNNFYILTGGDLSFNHNLPESAKEIILSTP